MVWEFAQEIQAGGRGGALVYFNVFNLNMIFFCLLSTAHIKAVSSEFVKWYKHSNSECILTKSTCSPGPRHRWNIFFGSFIFLTLFVLQKVSGNNNMRCSDQHGDGGQDSEWSEDDEAEPVQHLKAVFDWCHKGSYLWIHLEFF